MKFIRLKLAALCALGLLVITPAADAAVIVGTGASSSFLVIEAPEFGAPLEFEYRYTFNAGAPPDAYAMMVAIDLASPNLSFSFQDFSTGGPPNYFLTAITYDSITLTNATTGDFTPFWYQSVAGGEAGFPIASPIADGVWSEGSGISSPSRKLAPGSWDGFVYGEYGDEPSVSPVPEPTTIALFGVASLAVLGRRLRRSA